MKILYVNTSNKEIVKDAIIRTAIKEGMQYIEMENEVLVEGRYLFKVVEKCIADINNIVNSFAEHKNSIDIYFSEPEENSQYFKSNSFTRLKKYDYKKESNRVNTILKTKKYYNRRKYK